LALQKVTPAETEKYGIVGLHNHDLKLGEFAKINTIIEKPKEKNAPSLYASIGRYILTPRVFDFLENTHKGAIGEIQLTDGIDKLISEQDVYGYVFKGRRYDCGSKFGYLQATVEFGRKHPEVGAQFEEYLQKIVQEK
jgi:UTP--glucose-1-phosphate uridylyltransferase